MISIIDSSCNAEVKERGKLKKKEEEMHGVVQRPDQSTSKATSLRGDSFETQDLEN